MGLRLTSSGVKMGGSQTGPTMDSVCGSPGHLPPAARRYHRAAAIVTMTCVAKVCSAGESAKEECDVPRDLDAHGPGDSQPLIVQVPITGWGVSTLTRYIERAADDAWRHVLDEGIGGQITVLFMAGICVWLLGHMIRRPRSSCLLLLTWFGWIAWSIYSERLTWNTMENKTYNVYTQTHLCTSSFLASTSAKTAAYLLLLLCCYCFSWPQSGWHSMS